MRLPRPASFGSWLRSPAVTARVGLWLGICFGVCFLTGLISHYAQNPDHPVPFPTSPSWGYRLTQGLHVTTGTAAIPLLLVKLWSVYPLLFRRPRFQVRALLLTVLERASVAVLVAAAVFQLTTGLMNTTQWYPWSFSFRPTHYAVAWVAIGALVVHVAVQLPVIRDALRADVDATVHDRWTAVQPGAMSRRGLLRTTWLATGVVVLATAGSTVPLLRRVSVLGVRSGDGPQGLPINRSAEAAGVGTDVVGDAFRLRVAAGERVVSLSRDELAAMTQHTVELPIACVEGWSASATWSGVRVKDLLALVDVEPGSGGDLSGDVEVTSLQQRGAFGTSTLQANFVGDDRTLLALQVNGEVLDLDHGYPCRIIAPDRPGVLQTKWVTALEVVA